MTSILALAALGPWTFAGFLAEPTPAASAPTPPPASAPIRPADAGPISRPEPKQETSPASIAPPPTRSRLADSGGQVWEHAEPAYLRSFVEARNRSTGRQRDFQSLRSCSARCADGRCH